MSVTEVSVISPEHFPHVIFFCPKSEHLARTQLFIDLALAAASGQMVEHELAVRPTRWMGTPDLLEKLGIEPYTKADPDRQMAFASGDFGPALSSLDSQLAFIELTVTLPEDLQRAYRNSGVDQRLALIAKLERQAAACLDLLLTEGPDFDLAGASHVLASDLHEGSSLAENPGLHLHYRIFNITAAPAS